MSELFTKSRMHATIAGGAGAWAASQKTVKDFIPASLAFGHPDWVAAARGGAAVGLATGQGFSMATLLTAGIGVAGHVIGSQFIAPHMPAAVPASLRAPLAGAVVGFGVGYALPEQAKEAAKGATNLAA